MARIINVNIWFANERILQARGNSITNTMYPHYQHEITLLQARDNHPTSTYRSPPYGGGVGGGAFGVAAWASCGFVVLPVSVSAMLVDTLSKKISLKFLFLSDIFLFPFIRQQFPVLT